MISKYVKEEIMIREESDFYGICREEIEFVYVYYDYD